MRRRRRGQRAAVPGGSSTEQQRTPHTDRHLQSGSPCLAGGQAAGLQASGEGQCQGGSSGKRRGEKTKRLGFPRERLRQAPFPAQRWQLPELSVSPRSSSPLAMEKAPLSSLAAHRPTTNTSFLPPACVLLHQKPEELKATEDHHDASLRAKDFTSLSNSERSEIGL